MTWAFFFPKFSFPQILEFSPKKPFLYLIVHICIRMLCCINALFYKTYTFFDTHKNIDVMGCRRMIKSWSISGGNGTRKPAGGTNQQYCNNNNHTRTSAFTLNSYIIHMELNQVKHFKHVFGVGVR